MFLILGYIVLNLFLFFRVFFFFLILHNTVTIYNTRNQCNDAAESQKEKKTCFNPFIPNAPFLYPLKTLENFTVF